MGEGKLSPILTMTNVADTYYTDIKDSNDPAFELMKVYCDILRIETGISLKKMFNRLVSLYGVERTFVALLILLAREEYLPKNVNRVNFYLQGILSGKLRDELKENKLTSSPSLQELAEENYHVVHDKPSLEFRSEDE